MGACFSCFAIISIISQADLTGVILRMLRSMCAYLNVSRHSMCCLHGNLLETRIDTAMHESQTRLDISKGK